MLTLDDICVLITDGSHFSPEDEGTGYPMLSVKDMNGDHFDITACKHVGEEAFQKLVANGCRPQKNDVVVAKDGSYLKTAFTIKEESDIALLSSIAILRPKMDIVVPDYLSYFLKADSVYKTVSLNYISGTALKRVILKGLKKIPVDLPALEEQQYRVDLLNALQCIIKQRQQELQKLDELIKARFVELFGDPIKNPRRWEVVKIGDIITDVRYGTSKPAVEGGKYPYLRMNNLTADGHLDLRDLKYIDIPDDEIEKCIVRKGDVLFNRTNSIELVGKTAVFNLPEDMVIAGYIIRVRLNDRLLPEVLSQYMNLKALKDILRSMAKGAVNQANINAQELQSIKVYVPDMELQQQFIEIKKQVDKSKVVVQEALDKAQLLFDSLMQQYFG